MNYFLLTFVAIVALFWGQDVFAEIRIGLAGPFTGPNAAIGAQIKGAVQTAVDEMNKRGGVLGQQLSLTFGDDVSEPRQAVSVANLFVADGVNWVIGHYNSGASIPASEVYAESQIIQITPASTSDQFTDRSINRPELLVFRTCGRDDQQGVVAGEYIVGNYRGKRIAILHDKTTYGRGLAESTQKEMHSRGVFEVMFEGITAGEKDYSALISKLKSKNVDLIFFGGLHTEAALIIRQMHELGLRAAFMGGDGLLSNEFSAIAGPAAESTLMTFNIDPRTRPDGKQVAERLRARGIETEAYTLNSYASLEVLAQAAEGAKSIDGKKMAQFLRSGAPIHTAIGQLSYDQKGDLRQSQYVVYQWKKNTEGKIVPVQQVDNN